MSHHDLVQALTRPGEDELPERHDAAQQIRIVDHVHVGKVGAEVGVHSAQRFDRLPDGDADRQRGIVHGHHPARRIGLVLHQLLDLDCRVGVEGCNDCALLVHLEHPDQVGGLVGVHCRNQLRGSRRSDRLDNVGGRLGAHLVEHLAGVIGLEFGQQVGCSLFGEGFEDVGGVLRRVLGEVFPFLGVGVEVGLGFLRASPRQIANGLDDGARPGNPDFHGRSTEPNTMAFGSARWIISPIR